MADELQGGKVLAVEIADEMRLIGIFLLEGDVGKLVVRLAAELVERGLKTADPGKQCGRQAYPFLKTPFERTFRYLQFEP